MLTLSSCHGAHARCFFKVLVSMMSHLLTHRFIAIPLLQVRREHMYSLSLVFPRTVRVSTRRALGMLAECFEARQICRQCEGRHGKVVTSV